jgi:hypothetical protein
VNYQAVHTQEYNDTGVRLARTIVREFDHINTDFNVTQIGGEAWKGISIMRMFTLNIGAVMERGCRREFFGIEKISYNTRI